MKAIQRGSPYGMVPYHALLPVVEQARNYRLLQYDMVSSYQLGVNVLLAINLSPVRMD